MDWEAISEDALLELVEAAEVAMEPPVFAFWQRVRIRPVKWRLSPWGDMGGGFWVVALMGQECIWYNDIEDGFNISRFETVGSITDYWCNQTELDRCIRGYFECLMQAVGRAAEPGAAPDHGGM